MIECKLFTILGLEGGLFFRGTFQQRFYKYLSIRWLLAAGWKVWGAGGQMPDRVGHDGEWMAVG